MNWANRFMFDDPAPLMVDGTGLQADPDTLARVRDRQRAVREAMGPKWICHPEHSVPRQPQINIAAILEAAAAKRAENVYRIKRRTK